MEVEDVFDDPDTRLVYGFGLVIAVDDRAFEYARLWKTVELIEDGVASSDTSDIAKAWSRLRS